MVAEMVLVADKVGETVVVGVSVRVLVCVGVDEIVAEAVIVGVTVAVEVAVRV